MDNRPYLQYLPKTVYMTDYADATYQAISAFNNQVDPQVGDVEGFYLDCVGMQE